MSTEIRLSFGARLKEERHRLGMTQADMAKIAGVSARSLISWEKDEASPNATALAELAVQSQLDIHYLVKGQRMPVPRGVAAPFDIYDRHSDGSPDLGVKTVEQIKEEMSQLSETLSKTLKLYGIELNESSEKELRDFIKVYKLPIEKTVRLIALIRMEF